LKQPRVFFLDGASGAGKTTLALTLAASRPDVMLVPRYTTRPKRTDADEREYVFVSRAEFDAVKVSDKFVEYRDYDFGMSYGLPADAVEKVLAEGKHALAIVNLGRIRAAQERCPDAVSILVDVPLPILRDRLVARGVHSQEQLDERLTNALSVEQFRDTYDYVLLNVGEPAEVAARLDAIVGEY
jgi:guanylate kinase